MNLNQALSHDYELRNLMAAWKAGKLDTDGTELLAGELESYGLASKAAEVRET